MGWSEFLSEFQNVDTKILGKSSSFKKKLIKNIKLGLKVPKMIEKCEFYPNFDFSMNFRPLNPHYFIFCDLSFHRIFKMLILKSLEKYAVFKKKIIKNFQFGIKGPKIIKILEFLINFGPLNHPKYFFEYLFGTVHSFSKIL